MGHAHFPNEDFPNEEICISCELDRPTSVLFSCIMPEKLARKARLMSLWWVATPSFSTWKKKPIFKPKLTNAGAYREFVSPKFCAYGLYWPLKILPTLVGAYGQTNIGADTHTFQKKISINQARTYTCFNNVQKMNHAILLLTYNCILSSPPTLFISNHYKVPLWCLTIDILNFTTGLETEVVHVISLYKLLNVTQ